MRHTSTLAISALTLSAVCLPTLTLAQTRRPISHRPSPARPSKVVYLADLIPTVLNGRTPDKKWLKQYWQAGECRLQGHEFKNSISFGNWHDKMSAVFLTRRVYQYFDATVGINGSFPDASHEILFEVLGDNKVLLTTARLKAGDSPAVVHVPIANIARMEIRMRWGHDLPKGNAWWGSARFIKGNAKDIGALTASSRNYATSPRQIPIVGVTDPNDSGEGNAEQTSRKVLQIDPAKMKELATQLKAKVANDAVLSRSKPTLAIASLNLLPSGTLSPDNTETLRENLSTALIASEAFVVVERGQLDRAIDELKLDKKGLFDSATAQKFGKQVGAQVVLIGSVTNHRTYAMLNVRLIDTETGKVHFVVSIKLPQTDAPAKETP